MLRGTGFIKLEMAIRKMGSPVNKVPLGTGFTGFLVEYISKSVT